VRELEKTGRLLRKRVKGRNDNAKEDVRMIKLRK
jgi:hypothetical protein